MRGRISPITSAFDFHNMKGGHVVQIGGADVIHVDYRDFLYLQCSTTYK